MTVFLPYERETEVSGHGDGSISIKQTNESGESVEIWLTVHQFETIFNFEKSIVNEALDDIK